MTTHTNAFRIIENAHKKVSQQIEIIRIKIYQKSIDFLFFKHHRYTLEELLDSPEHNKINSITEKLGSDVHIWDDRGTLSEDEKNFYHKTREEIDEKLHEVNLEIYRRQPTALEKIKIVLDNFCELIMKNMPILQKINFPKLLKGVLQKLLPGS